MHLTLTKIGTPTYDEPIKKVAPKTSRKNVSTSVPLNLPTNEPTASSKNVSSSIPLDLPKTTTTAKKPATTFKPPKTQGIFTTQIGAPKPVPGASSCGGKIDPLTGKCSMDPGGMGGKQSYDIGFDILSNLYEPINVGVVSYEAATGKKLPIGGAQTNDYSTGATNQYGSSYNSAILSKPPTTTATKPATTTAQTTKANPIVATPKTTSSIFKGTTPMQINTNPDKEYIGKYYAPGSTGQFSGPSGPKIINL